MKTSDALDVLLPAFLAARQEFKPLVASQTAKTEKFSYDFANLNDYDRATSAALWKHGLVLIGATSNTPEAFNLELRLFHAASSQWVEATYPLRADLKPQEQGSQLTYFRRYLSATLLHAVIADDDGAEAHAGASERPSAPPRPAPAAPPVDSRPTTPSDRKGKLIISQAQQKRLFAIAHDAGWKDDEIRAVVKLEAGLEHTSDIVRGKYKGEYDALCAIFSAAPTQYDWPDVDAAVATVADAVNDEDYGPDAASGADEDMPF